MSSRPPLWPFLLLLVPVALGIDFTRFHEFHHGDSVVPILTSLYEWTPFFWDSNRNGSLIPLLALPFRTPLANLLVQSGIGIFSGLAAYFILCFYLVRQRVWPWIATFAAAQFLWLFPPVQAFEMLCGCQPYFLSMALGVGALLLVNAHAGKSGWSRLALACVLMALAHWVNLGLVIVLGPLIVFRALFATASEESAPTVWGRLAKHEKLRRAFVLVLGTVAGFLAMRTLGVQDTGLAVQPIEAWPRCISRLAKETWDGASPAFWRVALLVASASIGALVCRQTRPVARNACRNSFALLATAGIYFVLMANLKWVEGNAFNFRYALPAIILAQLAAIIPVAIALEHCIRQSLLRLALPLALPILMMAAFASFGLPSLDEPRAALNRSIGSFSADIVEAKCTHVVGNYFDVWPTVFHANLTLSERGASEVIWGITHRCEPTSHYWTAMARHAVRVAAPIVEEGAHPFGGNANHYLKSYFPQFRAQELRPTIEVYVAE